MEIHVALGPSLVTHCTLDARGLSPSILEGGESSTGAAAPPGERTVLSRLLEPCPRLSLQGPAAQDGSSACEGRKAGSGGLLPPTGPPALLPLVLHTCPQLPSVQHPQDSRHIAPMVGHMPLLG